MASRKARRRFPWWLRTKRGYAAYLRSAEWEAFRESYYRTHEKRCFVRGCGAESIRLHHISYRAVGQERPRDVVPLCREHHIEVHALINKGVPLSKAHLQLEHARG